MCCEFHIGLNFPSKRLQCRRKCGKVIKSNTIDKKTKKKGLKGKKNKSKKYKKGKGKEKKVNLI